MRARTWFILAFLPFVVVMFSTWLRLQFKWMVEMPLCALAFAGVQRPAGWIDVIGQTLAPLFGGHHPVVLLYDACA